MAAGKLNLNIEQGATFRKSLTWKDETGNPVDLTGYTASMRIAVHGAAYMDLSTADNSISLASGGVINLLIPAEVTDAMTWAVGKYDLKLVGSNGDEVRLVEGSVYVSPAITPRQ